MGGGGADLTPDAPPSPAARPGPDMAAITRPNQSGNAVFSAKPASGSDVDSFWRSISCRTE